MASEYYPICLQGDYEGIAEILQKFNVAAICSQSPQPIGRLLVETIRVTVLGNSAHDDSVWQIGNSEMVCLIDFNQSQADAVSRIFGGIALFNFADLAACADFLIGYYYALALGVENLDIYDISCLLGYKQGQTRRIRSVEPEMWQNETDTTSFLLYSFAGAATSPFYQDLFRQMWQSSTEDQAMMFLARQTDEAVFNKLIIK